MKSQTGSNMNIISFVITELHPVIYKDVLKLDTS